jgi:hypothetical protein
MTHFRLVPLILESSWPPCRDPMRADADWMLYIGDLRRVVRGIPSVFA